MKLLACCYCSSYFETFCFLDLHNLDLHKPQWTQKGRLEPGRGIEYQWHNCNGNFPFPAIPPPVLPQSPPHSSPSALPTPTAATVGLNFLGPSATNCSSTLKMATGSHFRTARLCSAVTRQPNSAWSFRTLNSSVYFIQVFILLISVLVGKYYHIFFITHAGQKKKKCILRSLGLLTFNFTEILGS